MTVPSLRVLALGILAAARTVAANPAPLAAPWSEKVSEADKASAKQLVDEGNALFVDKRFKEALDTYTRAVARWDHPAIRFNIVRCLIQLDRSVEASDQLDQALAYGAEPFEPAIYDEAVAFKKMLGNQIATVELACKQTGARVMLDGQPAIAACPGEHAIRVQPGHHAVTGIESGFLTRTIEVVSVGGAHDRVDVTLEPLASSARIVHRWASWKPWLVFGAGAAVAGFGGLLHTFAVNEMDEYDREVAAQCSHVGCTGDAAPRQPGSAENVAAIGLMSAGVAALATGGVLLYLNRSRTVYPSEHVTVAPLPGGAALAVFGSF